jgi:hypothetical protein
VKRVTKLLSSAGVLAVSAGAILALGAGPASATSYQYKLWMAFDDVSTCQWWRDNNNRVSEGLSGDINSKPWWYCTGRNGAELWYRIPV